MASFFTSQSHILHSMSQLHSFDKVSSVPPETVTYTDYHGSFVKIKGGEMHNGMLFY